MTQADEDVWAKSAWRTELERSRRGGRTVDSVTLFTVPRHRHVYEPEKSISNRSPTATVMAWSSSLVPTDVIGKAFKKSLECGAETAKRRALSLGDEHELRSC
ncbi:hypothetical protein ACOME3_008569 [Neoechinorhynchus agilis]